VGRMRFGSRGIGRRLLVACVVGLLAVAASALAAAGSLTPQGCIHDTGSVADSCGQSANGLNQVDAVAVSPDGKSVYATGFQDKALVRFKRNTTSGALTAQGCIKDNDTSLETCAQSTDGLAAPTAAVVSADGKSVYVAGFGDAAVVRFKRNTTSGALTPKGCIDDNDTGADSCAQSTDGLAGVQGLAISKDGKSLYAAANNDDAVVTFKRNTTSGALTPKGCIDDNDTGTDNCGVGTNGLEGAGDVAVSPDKKSVYVVSASDGALVRFKRNTTTGALTPKGCVDDNDDGADTCAHSADGLSGLERVAVSPDSKSVYTTSFGDDAVARFNRSSAGALTPAGCIEDTGGLDSCAQNTKGLNAAFGITVSSDNKSVYATGAFDDAVVLLKRNTTTGAITPGGCVEDDDTGVDGCAGTADGLDNVQSVAVSADGKSVYAAAVGDSAVTMFKRG
jgi:hypothetical protein